MRKKVIFCAALLFGMIIGISVGALAGVFFAGAPSVPVEVTGTPKPGTKLTVSQSWCAQVTMEKKADVFK